MKNRNKMTEDRHAGSMDIQKKQADQKREEETARAAEIVNDMQNKSAQELIEALENESIPKGIINEFVPAEEAAEEEAKPERSYGQAAREKIPGLMQLTKQHKKIATAIILTLIVLLYIFLEQISAFFTVFLLFVLASFSTIYKRKLGIPLGGFELVTFGTVMTGAVYGPVVGAIFGTLTHILSSVLSTDIGPLTLMGTATLGGAGIAAGLFHTPSIFLTGAVITALVLLVSQGPYLLLGDPEIQSTTFFYVATNLLTNIILFATLGPVLAGVLA
jgi:hypothetical protein